MKDFVVKIDGELLKEVEEYISQKENRLKYANKKQFINMAVLDKLNSEKKNKKR